MDQTEFEHRKRHLEAELEAGVELLRASFRAQMRALEQVWLASPANVTLFPAPATPPAPPARAQPALPPPSTKRRPARELIQQICGFLAVLPEVFDRNDLVPLLGYRPKRTSLANVFEELCHDGVLAIAERGRGMTPTRYRRLRAVAPDTPET